MKNGMFGVMIDCSRNAVMRPESIKRMVDILSSVGYNTLMLYTEDTYEVAGQPFFGHLRGRYTEAELQDLARYCQSKGVELIPCIQTLAHLGAIFKWRKEYLPINDCDDVLLIDDEKTYQLIDDMFAAVSRCFLTKKIHIGMDEAYRVGLGKYLAQHGYRERFDVINSHLHRVCEMAKKYGLEPMVWSDMFCKLALQNEDYYAGRDWRAIEEKANLPEDVSLVYWDYYSDDYDRYDRMIKINQAFHRPVLFAGGAWTWCGFAPDNAFSIRNTLPAMQACAANGVSDVLMTLWGDDGGECSRFSVLPTLFYAAALQEQWGGMETVKQRFKACCGMEYDSFLLLDKLNTPPGEHTNTAAKYLLYSDPLMGLTDWRLGSGVDAYYGALRDRLNGVEVAEEFRPIFESAAALCDVLSVKSELGLRTRAAYGKADKAALRRLAEVDYPAAAQKVRLFHAAFERFWMSENKPHGFDVQDHRLGGVAQRLESCRRRILAYCDGVQQSIPELEEELLPMETLTCWSRIISPNVISHHL